VNNNEIFIFLAAIGFILVSAKVMIYFLDGFESLHYSGQNNAFGYRPIFQDLSTTQKFLVVIFPELGILLQNAYTQQKKQWGEDSHLYYFDGLVMFDSNQMEILHDLAVEVLHNYSLSAHRFLAGWNQPEDPAWNTNKTPGI
jgi:hypothetical protein